MSDFHLPSNLKWIGFDLDDTLHHFRKASGIASEAVYRSLETQSGASIDQIRSEYCTILEAVQKSCFADGKPSKEYRAERFTKLLTKFSLAPRCYLDQLLNLYDKTLAENLELKTGGKQVLRAAKNAGLQVMIVTEGPHDAQELTLQRLGITPFIDLLITSANERLSKADGLLAVALRKGNCTPNEFLYIGDSLENDIIPARNLCIQCLYVGKPTLIPNDITHITLQELTILLDKQHKKPSPLDVERA